MICRRWVRVGLSAWLLFLAPACSNHPRPRDDIPSELLPLPDQPPVAAGGPVPKPPPQLPAPDKTSEPDAKKAPNPEE